MVEDDKMWNLLSEYIYQIMICSQGERIEVGEFS